MYAKVVIDIPDLSHKGFDYLVPTNLIKAIKPGCRVLVPLGSRTTQGYVMETKDKSDYKEARAIITCLDVVPSLSQELLELAKWMSEYYFSHLYRTLQILLPAALKTKIEEYIVVNQKVDMLLSETEREIIDWVAKKQPVRQTNIINQFIEHVSAVEKLIDSGILLITKEHLDKATQKKVSLLVLEIPREQLIMEIADLPKRAEKQRQLLEYFMFNDLTEIEIPLLTAKINVNRSTIDGLIKKGFFSISEKRIDRDPYRDRFFSDKKVNLNDKQQQVFNKIIAGFNKKNKRPFLLYGVTGSGKTEIYLNTIEYGIKQGYDSIVLVPEISLTPQMVERFKGRFGSQVAVMHSRLSQGEKLDEWRRIQRGDAKIVIGARSAIFAPVKKLGLIIIDEEHEGSYKQEEHPKYHVREIAKWRAEYNEAIIVLGSATPSMESYYYSTINQYDLLELPERIAGSTMPTVHLVDMRDELRAGNRSMFSHTLQQMIEDRLEKKEQVVLFLNRRGYSTFVMCRSCGYVMKCPHCEISLTYHHSNKQLRCHYCGYSEKEPKICPECGSKYIRYFGTGTQKVEEELSLRFPGVRIIRMDVDTTGRKGAHERLLSSFRNQEADILLGTQMIAKGLDFPLVTLVGVIAADITLKLPDFRSSERSFQLLTQVSGRAGRHQLAGDVIIQTYTPEHYSIQYASNHDYNAFFKHELSQRRILAYPPLNKLVLINFSHQNLTSAMEASEIFVRYLKKVSTVGMEILGPVAAPISRIKDRYRFQCMIKYSDEANILLLIHQTINRLNDEVRDRSLQISVDVDPYSLM